MIKILLDIWKIPELRRRVLWTLGLLCIFRLGFFVYLPGVDIPTFLSSQKQTGTVINWLLYTSSLTGGNLQTPVWFALGIMPYISASIIFSLLIKVFPRLEALSKEGEQGRRVINRYTRYFTLVLCLIQGYFLVASFHEVQGSTYMVGRGWWWWTVQVVCLSVGSLFLMWLGEKITEVGIGNGTSLIIMVGIVADLPGQIGLLAERIRQAEWDQVPFEVSKAVVMVLLYFAVVAGVVFITKGQRRIPIQQQKAVKGRRVYGGQRHYMPIK
ncbi:MAG: preprotein translocase subunit SecY, partial [Planctomycetes bacterium]|nr:preprotein translocase subunit SecY [Planctomycetota bacterium]